jgi:hypothetical protein
MEDEMTYVNESIRKKYVVHNIVNKSRLAYR